MVILSSEKIREWDEFTIQHEPIASIDLMERAAAACVEWVMANGFRNKSYSIFCGKGNNGGDGLVIARMLSLGGHSVRVYILEFGHLGTADFQKNLERLHDVGVEIKFISERSLIPAVDEREVVIDALLGTGLNRPVDGLTRELIERMNAYGATIVSVDIPSGLSADQSSRGNVAIQAAITLTFECLKLAFLLAENQVNIGKLVVLDIGLHSAFPALNDLHVALVETPEVKRRYRSRAAFSHKGTFGHSLLIGGSYGKIGAAVLAGKACLRSGTGLLTVNSPSCGYHIVQSCIPEAMVITDEDEKKLTSLTAELSKYNAIGVGPGLGTDTATAEFLREVLKNATIGLVLDADALNILSANPDWLKMVPAGSVLTPHPKEFERLFGATENDFEKIEAARKKAKEHGIVIVLKGRYTCVASPSGKLYFNSTGNSGLATGGTGDVLTGIITGLMAQGYGAEDAAILGVYLHGYAADLATSSMESEESMIASDVVEYLGRAFKAVFKS